MAREARIGLRVDADLYRAAYEKALQYGGLSAVIRAMLRKFVKGEANFDIDDLADENRRAPKGKDTR
jgi:antitoxin component of RelBE/YafQ-DinJ toxin-antitoxin module